MALSDDTGIIQHAVLNVPNRSTGYCIDDVARAWTVALSRLRVLPGDAGALRVAATSLAFMHDAQLPDGRFHNFMGYDRAWLDTAGTPDSNGRTARALGYGMLYAPKASWRELCAKMLTAALPSIGELTYTRSQSFAAVGLSYALAAQPENGAMRSTLSTLIGCLKASYREEHGDDWEWYEPVMTYDNARLPEAMLRGGATLGDADAVAIGLTTLKFYAATTIENGVFVPIGCRGWYYRGGDRARFAQQPLEAAALVDAALAASDVSGDPAFLELAWAGLSWYYGRNSASAVLVIDGGCCDGLEADYLNRNMGAESTLAHLSAAYALAESRSEAKFSRMAKYVRR